MKDEEPLILLQGHLDFWLKEIFITGISIILGMLHNVTFLPFGGNLIKIIHGIRYSIFRKSYFDSPDILSHSASVTAPADFIPRGPELQLMEITRIQCNPDMIHQESIYVHR